jgi:hypothetical protein
MTIALGNKKPELLLEVEKVIWRALLTLSEGTKAPEDVLRDLHLQIPWQTFQPQVLTDVSEWFTIPSTHVSAAPIENILPAPLRTDFPVSDNQAMDQSLDCQLQAPPTRPSSPLPDDQAMDQSPDCELQEPRTLNPDTLSDHPTPPAEEADSPPSMEQSSEASAYRRSKRLASERRKEQSLTAAPSIYSRPRKRKAPTGEEDVDTSLSPGGSQARPIDVDALHAVMERYPLKREPQVCASRTVNRNISDEFLVPKAGCQAYRASRRGTSEITTI